MSKSLIKGVKSFLATIGLGATFLAIIVGIIIAPFFLLSIFPKWLAGLVIFIGVSWVLGQSVQNGL